MTVSVMKALAPLSQRLLSPLPWMMAVVVVLAVGLGACSSTPKDEATTSNAEKLYKEAREDMDSGSYEKAIKAFERVEGLAAGSLLAQQAQLDLAYLNWRSGERAAALTAVDRFIKLNPSSPALDYALYLRGMINYNDDLGVFGKLFGQEESERDQHAARDAYQAFKQLVDQFPNSRYSTDGRRRMNHIVDLLARYEVHVARYYYRRGAYVAAASRASQVVNEFQLSQSTEEALYLMSQCYAKLDLPILRDDAERVLRKNFPDSVFLRDGMVADTRPWWKLW